MRITSSLGGAEEILFRREKETRKIKMLSWTGDESFGDKLKEQGVSIVCRKKGQKGS